MILYRVVRNLLLLINKAAFRVTVEGKEHIPADGAFVLAPVHRSFLDFALVSAVTPRRMRYMGKDSLWKFKPLGWFISTLGAFPVHRGAADREALRRSIEVVEAGEPLVIFPEGTRRSGPVVDDLFEGAAYVAARAGVPIVPVGIGGSEAAQAKGKRLPRPTKVHIVVGRPIPPPATRQRKVVHAATEQLRAEVQRLFDQAQAAVTNG
ncbi:MAG: putative acyltransferase [Acidimicrobiales bacterium]|nr:putative acyltransferase [Acidimicrobiales bacterium]